MCTRVRFEERERERKFVGVGVGVGVGVCASSVRVCALRVCVTESMHCVVRVCVHVCVFGCVCVRFCGSVRCVCVCVCVVCVYGRRGLGVCVCACACAYACMSALALHPLGNISAPMVGDDALVVLVTTSARYAITSAAEFWTHLAARQCTRTSEARLTLPPSAWLGGYHL